MTDEPQPPEPLPPLVRPQVDAPSLPVAPPVAARPPRGFAAGALILGVIAFLNGWLPIVGVVMGVPALVLGAVALNRKQPKHFAVTGLVTGALGTACSALATLALMN